MENVAQSTIRRRHGSGWLNHFDRIVLDCLKQFDLGGLMKWLPLAVALSFSQLACSDPFGDAQRTNTVDAFEQFITENGKSARVFEARMAIERLMVEQARASQKVEDFDAYLTRFKKDPPSKKTYRDVIAERKDALWNMALNSNAIEDWERFIEEYKIESPKDVRIAKQRLTIAKYLKNLKMDPIEKTQVNVSGDENGPLNGWEFSTKITNSGDKDIKTLRLRLSFLDADGMIVDRKDFAVIGCGDYCQRMFVFDDPSYAKAEPELDRIRPPMKAGKARDFIVQTGNLPPSWSKKIRTDFVSITFED